MIKAVARKSINITIKHFFKRLLVISIIITNLFFYIPNVTFAADDDEDTQEMVPAIVPAAANDIISKFVSTGFAGGSSGSSGGGIITNYEEKGDGWNSTTEVEATNGVKRTYRNYKQYIGSYAGESYMGGTIGLSGCGPTTVSIILSGYHIDASPLEVSKKMNNVTSGTTISNALNSYGIENELHNVGKDGSENAKKIIRENLQKGNPVMIGVKPGDYTSKGHWMALIAIDGDTVTISNCGRDPDNKPQPENITEKDDFNKLVDTDMSGCDYVVITDERESVSNKSTSSRASSYTRETSSSRSKNSSSGTGKANIQKCNVQNGGYDAIFTSGTTGRQFKEYRQNIPGWDSKYRISHLANTNRDWTGECGAVSTITVGSGYSKSATFEDLTKKMVSSNGNTNIIGWASQYASQSAGFVGYSSSDMVSKLSKGCVAIIHGTSSNVSTSGTHYMSILDIKPDKSAVYVSNPWAGSPYQGWISVSTINSDFGADSILYLSNDGSKVNYGSGGQIDSLDNFLIIGDSRTYAIENKLEALGKNVVAKGVSASTPAHWKEVTKNGSGTVLNTSVTLPSKDSIKGVVVALGVNGTSQVSEMKEVLNNLTSRYPDVPVFVTSVFHVGEKYQYGTLTASKMNDNIDSFNNSMKEFCNSSSNLMYIDITSGLYDDKGFLKSSYTSDGLHLNNSGNDILVKNIKEEILNSGLVSSFEDSNTVNMSGNITKIEDSDNPNHSGYKINVDWDKEIDEMLETLRKEDFKLEKYLDKSLQKEYLKNMLKAAIVTQYPDLRSAEEIASDAEIPTDETQGCIKIKRYADGETKAFAGYSLSEPKDSEDEGMYLAYRPYEDLSKMINDGNREALKYFSLDSSNNIVVAGWETMDVEVSIKCQDQQAPESVYGKAEAEVHSKEYQKLTMKTADYLSQVSNYTMPFSLLWSLLVYGNDEDFVNDLANLVIDSEIVMGVYDATQTKVSTYTHTFTYEGKATSTPYTGEGANSKQQDSKSMYVTYTYVQTEVDTLKTDTPSVKLKHADIWTAVYDYDFKVEYNTTKSDNKDNPVKYDDQSIRI